MALPRPAYTANVISLLSMLPNAVNGLSGTQLKAKFDELDGEQLAYMNTVLDALESSELSNEGAKSIGCNFNGTLKVQDALDYIASAGTGTIPPDSSIGTSKLQADAVTDEKIASISTGFLFVPENGIIRWPSTSDIPAGFKLCDGNDFTPDYSGETAVSIQNNSIENLVTTNKSLKDDANSDGVTDGWTYASEGFNGNVIKTVGAEGQKLELQGAYVAATPIVNDDITFSQVNSTNNQSGVQMAGMLVNGRITKITGARIEGANGANGGFFTLHNSTLGIQKVLPAVYGLNVTYDFSANPLPFSVGDTVRIYLQDSSSPSPQFSMVFYDTTPNRAGLCTSSKVFTQAGVSATDGMIAGTLYFDVLSGNSDPVSLSLTDYITGIEEGQTYRISFREYVVEDVNIVHSILWYNSLNQLISESLTGAYSHTVLTLNSNEFVAPANASKAKLKIKVTPDSSGSFGSAVLTNVCLNIM